MSKPVAMASTSLNVALLIITILMLMQRAGARELRPSYHGLDYQTTPPAGEKLPPEMKSFFGAANASASSSGGMALPKAMNANDTAWWNSVNGGGSKGRDRVRHVLLVASLVCGVTGVVLLVTSGLIYIFRYNKRQNLVSK